MTTRTDMTESPLIESRDDLLSVFSGGEKTRERWRIGTEHEKFVYRIGDHRAPSWEEPGGIGFLWRKGRLPQGCPEMPSVSNDFCAKAMRRREGRSD